MEIAQGHPLYDDLIEFIDVYLRVVPFELPKDKDTVFPLIRNVLDGGVDFIPYQVVFHIGINK